MRRTHTCGNLRKSDIDKKVLLQGWAHSRRDHGGLIFIDLRDRYGFTQIVFDPKSSESAHKIADSLRREDVIEVAGLVRARPEGMANPNLSTGDIEMLVSSMSILNKAETPPLEIDEHVTAGEDIRLKFRYLDLRRPSMQKNIITRHKALQATREYLSENGFLELETPMLIRSTPEGARDYVVPSRVHPGKVYSLPQSPQLYKQICMVAGFDRYFQIARCLRDEDLRADRQPEFTQIDVEMSFAEEEDIFMHAEKMMQHIFNKSAGLQIDTPFQRLTYDESISKYGTDKPDLRFGLELSDVTDIVKNSEFEVFKKAPMTKCLAVPDGEKISRKEVDRIIEFAQKNKAKGLAWMRIKEGKCESSIAKFFSEELQAQIINKTSASEGCLLLFIADKPSTVNFAMSALRNKLGSQLKLYNPKEFKFCWITDFPLYEWNEEEEKLEPAHHIFTMPKQEDIKYLDSEPRRVRAQCYDLVLNGVELGSGSIRIHREDIQEAVMKVIGLKKEDAHEKFGFLLEAFKYGAPPHGGIALGFDRITALMCGTNDIREVILFPKTKSAESPMDGCPTHPDNHLMKELHIKFDA